MYESFDFYNKEVMVGLVLRVINFLYDIYSSYLPF
jgi:hypothetical protein